MNGNKEYKSDSCLPTIRLPISTPLNNRREKSHQPPKKREFKAGLPLKPKKVIRIKNQKKGNTVKIPKLNIVSLGHNNRIFANISKLVEPVEHK